MEVLCRRGGIDHLNVVIGSEPKETLQPRTGMFRARPLESMRQQKDHSAELLPFVLRAGNELVHDRLRHIPEVAELRLPQDQRFRAIQTIAILEAQHARFAKWAVDDLNGRLSG